MEHGHANHLSDDWSSMAYWYPTLPCKPFSIAPVNERLPLRFNEGPTIEQRAGSLPAVELTDDMRDASAHWRACYDEYVRACDDIVQRCAEKSRQDSASAIDEAQRIHEDYDRGAPGGNSPADRASEKPWCAAAHPLPRRQRNPRACECVGRPEDQHQDRSLTRECPFGVEDHGVTKVA
jgi:hypothetical protein